LTRLPSGKIERIVVASGGEPGPDKRAGRSELEEMWGATAWWKLGISGRVQPAVSVLAAGGIAAAPAGAHPSAEFRPGDATEIALAAPPALAPAVTGPRSGETLALPCPTAAVVLTELRAPDAIEPALPEALESRPCVACDVAPVACTRLGSPTKDSTRHRTTVVSAASSEPASVTTGHTSPLLTSTVARARPPPNQAGDTPDFRPTAAQTPKTPATAAIRAIPTPGRDHPRSSFSEETGSHGIDLDPRNPA
jgi:hypothetical protein